MSLQGIPLEKITAADIERLVATGASKSVTLDFKRDTYAPDKDRSTEYLKDISAFANTLGGDIVIGVNESDGTADEVVGFHGNLDEELLWLEQVPITGLEPRLMSLKVRAIATASGPVIVVRVGRSFAPPHRVTSRGSNKFWARAGTMKYEPNVDQLRQLFNSGAEVGERLRAFRTDRLVKIAAGETPISMNTFGKLAIHVVAVPSFTDGRLADIRQVLDGGSHTPLPPDDIRLRRRHGVNFDGFVNYTVSDPTQRSAYAQFLRNGAIEGVAELPADTDGTSIIRGAAFTRLVIETIRQYLGTLASYEAGLPVAVFVALCNASRTINRYGVPGGGFYDTGHAGREILALPEILIQEGNPDIPALMLPAFNILWNAFGRERCDAYDPSGQWLGEGGGS